MPWATAARKYFNVPSITLSLIISACRTLYKMHNQVMYFVLHSLHGLVIGRKLRALLECTVGVALQVTG